MNAKALMKKYTMVIALVVVFILFAILTSGRLLLPQNLSNLLLQNAYVLVMACGMLLCILTGGNIDLSIGSTVCLVGAISAVLLKSNFAGDPTATALLVILIGLALAILIGMWQGFLIGYVHIPPFICTLAGMFLFRGIGRAILDSKTVAISNRPFLNIFGSYISIPGLDDIERIVELKGRPQNQPIAYSALIIGILVAVFLVARFFMSRANKSKKGYKLDPLVPGLVRTLVISALLIYYTWKLANYKGIPVMAIWVVAVVLIYNFITSKTALGRYFYAVGGNEKATKLSGIDTRRVYFLAYTSMSMLAGLAGMLVATRVGSVNGDTGNAFEMDAIGSCFIGGASAYGGSGTVSGIMVGAILLGIINQGMSIIGLDNNWQYVVKGAVLLAAVVFDVVSNHKKGKG